jgi:hypothetical protein
MSGRCSSRRTWAKTPRFHLNLSGCDGCLRSDRPSDLTSPTDRRPRFPPGGLSLSCFRPQAASSAQRAARPIRGRYVVGPTKLTQSLLEPVFFRLEFLSELCGHPFHGASTVHLRTSILSRCLRSSWADQRCSCESLLSFLRPRFAAPRCSLRDGSIHADGGLPFGQRAPPVVGYEHHAKLGRVGRAIVSRVIVLWDNDRKGKGPAES